MKNVVRVLLSIVVVSFGATASDSVQVLNLDIESQHHRITGMEDRMDEINRAFRQSVADVGVIGRKDLKVLSISEENSVPLEDLVEDIDAGVAAETIQAEFERRELAQQIMDGKITVKDIERFVVSNMYPVTTKLQSKRALSDVLLFDEEKSAIVPESFVVIGVDAYSLDWLTVNIEEVKRLGTLIYVSQIDRHEDMLALRQLFPGFDFVPVDVYDLMKMLGVDHYPVLVTKAGAFQ
ncbi:hypothetical protein A6E01_19375 (plasmid) [Vibrio breoganii]|uniref:Integrating conjugative element protein n=2 Tax=Vibrio TaxID=662 RepID=A0AAN1CUB6_9VIBR|nr:DUF2859 domain-containing protein [Vibrio breoganii]ANO35377.1 hypothetical protein A6E01_19375 [Vibrio breoganii]PML12701.1 hypothetical protein BCT84_02130 [Vibrio breoganii]